MQYGALSTDRDGKIISLETGKDDDHRSSARGYKSQRRKKSITIPNKPDSFPGLLGLNVGILPNESRMVSEEEDNNNKTISEGADWGDEGG